MSNQPRVLITNAEERSMLAACRSLSQRGYEVTATSSTMFAAAQSSRSCAARLLVADARDHASRFVEQLRQELTRRAYRTLLAGSDSSLLAISRGREHLGNLTELGLPSHTVVQRALSRESLAEAAEQAGFVPPTSIACVGMEEALEAARCLGFPVVLKSTDAAIVRGDAVAGAPKGQIVSSEAELARASLAFGNERLLIQRWAGDHLISFGGVRAGASLIAVAVSRYRRMWPPPGGSVSFSETIAPPAQLEAMVERLLAAIGWEGIFELELIRSHDGDFVPIDLNPRPYGSMALAGAAGAPLARIWCDWLLGRSPSPVRARPGHRYRWEVGDLRHLAWQLRHGHLAAAMAPLRPRRDVTHAAFELRDPLPLLVSGLYLGKRLSEESGHRGANSRRAPRLAGGRSGGA
jgi:predicted ATP-grasp superfamily ATP-dependent carboligase